MRVGSGHDQPQQHLPARRHPQRPGQAARCPAGQGDRDVPACAKRTFAEQVPGLTARYGRKTALLAGVQQDIAVALAGRAGCRLARSLQVPASRQVLLRLVMAVPDPAAPAPRVLGGR